MRLIHQTGFQHQLAIKDFSDCILPQISYNGGEGSIIKKLPDTRNESNYLDTHQNIFGINAAMNAAGVALVFNPFGSALGGASMGLACIMSMALNGRSLNPAKALGGIMKGEKDVWPKVATVVGLGAGGVALRQLMPYNLQSIPDSFATWRSIVAGLCLGIGSSMAEKGDAIPELSTGSKDSLVHLVTFMATAMATAQLASSGLELGLPPGKPNYSKPDKGELEDHSTVLSAGAAMLLAMYWMGKQSKGGDQKDLLGLISEVATGMLYGAGTGLAGLTRPQKMIAWLSPMEDFWNMSIPFVYLGAVGVTFAGFKLLKEKVKGPAMKSSYDFPDKDKAERKRIIGSVLYGVGVGMCGLGSSSALVACCANPTKQLSILTACMLGGVLLEQQVLGDEVSVKVSS